ncbi:MAG: ATP synthase F1 subunit epsilon [Pseudobdellovibrionaceae bacterium]|jgi:F-type H+-transporting ATPase subunit epsilon
MFKLNLVTPEKKIVMDQELAEISLPAFAGELNILPGHAPLLTTLAAGILKYKLKTGETKKMAISWGYCQVSSEGVNVLAETAVESDEIDVKVVQENLKGFERKLIAEHLNDEDWTKAHHEIERLKAEINLLNVKH